MSYPLVTTLTIDAAGSWGIERCWAASVDWLSDGRRRHLQTDCDRPDSASNDGNMAVTSYPRAPTGDASTETKSRSVTQCDSTQNSATGCDSTLNVIWLAETPSHPVSRQKGWLAGRKRALWISTILGLLSQNNGGGRGHRTEFDSLSLLGRLNVGGGMRFPGAIDWGQQVICHRPS